MNDPFKHRHVQTSAADLQTGIANNEYVRLYAPERKSKHQFPGSFLNFANFFWKFFKFCKITSEQKETLGQFHKRYMPTLKCKMLAFFMPNVIILNFQFFEIVLAFIVSCPGVTQLGGLVTVL